MYEYKTVQYSSLGLIFILEPFTDAIQQHDGQMFEYPVYFFKSMTLLQFKQERKLHEEALLNSKIEMSEKTLKFLGFYIKWKRLHKEYSEMRKYMKYLYGSYPPWQTFEEI